MRHLPTTNPIQKKHVLRGAFFVGSISVLYAGMTAMFAPVSYVATSTPSIAQADVTTSAEDLTPPVVHVKIPDAVKAVYMSSWVAGTPSIRARVVNIINTTEINSVVLDIKDYSGRISYEVSDPALLASGAVEKRISDIRGLISDLHKDNVYVIGRIAVFQDEYFVKMHPELAVHSRKTGGVWKDYKGIAWVDSGSREMWDYAIAIAKDAHAQGFDEINFDYVRFPADGDIKDMTFPISNGKEKPAVMKEFYQYLGEHMKTAGITTSADLFGMTMTSTDDLNIGQVLEDALPHFDYIAPMVYPSHYPKGFNNWSNPNAHPYELIHFVMSAGATRATEASTTPLKLRPWLQDFSLGAPKYGKAEVEAQIQATYDAGLTSWMLWDPSNKYAGGALLPE